MNLKPMSLNQSSKTNPSNKIPSWIDLNANETTSIFFLVFLEDQDKAFNAVKNSTLPQEVIDYLTAEGTFTKLLNRAGFEIGYDSGLSALLFKGVLGKYIEDFLNIIAPYVYKNSYIEIKEAGSKYRWKFDGSTCKKIHQKIVWE